jgi:hypothetical protein
LASFQSDLFGLDGGSRVCPQCPKEVTSFDALLIHMCTQHDVLDNFIPDKEKLKAKAATETSVGSEQEPEADAASGVSQEVPSTIIFDQFKTGTILQWGGISEFYSKYYFSF